MLKTLSKLGLKELSQLVNRHLGKAVTNSFNIILNGETDSFLPEFKNKIRMFTLPLLLNIVVVVLSINRQEK